MDMARSFMGRTNDKYTSFVSDESRVRPADVDQRIGPQLFCDDDDSRQRERLSAQSVTMSVDAEFHVENVYMGVRAGGRSPLRLRTRHITDIRLTTSHTSNMKKVIKNMKSLKDLRKGARESSSSTQQAPPLPGSASTKVPTQPNLALQAGSSTSSAAGHTVDLSSLLARTAGVATTSDQPYTVDTESLASFRQRMKDSRVIVSYSSEL
jgi:hypothetical protein